MLTSKNRAKLRGLANPLSPLFQIGKDGIEPALVNTVGECLAARELVKVRCLETCPLATRQAAEQLARQTGAELVQVIGRVMVLYLQRKKDSAYAGLLAKGQ